MSSKNFRMLIINLGSTSTKIAVYEDEMEMVKSTIKHSSEQLKMFSDVWEQYDFRKTMISSYLEQNGYNLEQFNAIVSRGGTIIPVPSGVYIINKKMLEDMKSGNFGKHACNVGCQICYDLGNELGVLPITVDPPASNEMMKIATYSGVPHIWRRGSFHVLNQKAIARRLAKDLNKKYEEMNIIIVHLGGGISVGAHQRGKVIDVNNALDGDGPFSPERSGSLPVGELVKICFSGQYTESEIHKMITGRGGMVAYLGTTDALDIEKRIKDGDKMALEVVEAMAYQIAKEIGAVAVAFNGDVEAITLTGGLSNWDRLVGLIKKRVAFLGPIFLYPGEDELQSLALGALGYLKGEVKCQKY